MLSNGFSVGCIISVLLHLTLPFDAVDNVDADSASAVSKHVNPTDEADATHQKVACTCMLLAVTHEGVKLLSLPQSLWAQAAVVHDSTRLVPCQYKKQALLRCIA